MAVENGCQACCCCCCAVILATGNVLEYDSVGCLPCMWPEGACDFLARYRVQVGDMAQLCVTATSSFCYGR